MQTGGGRQSVDDESVSSGADAADIAMVEDDLMMFDDDDKSPSLGEWIRSLF